MSDSLPDDIMGKIFGFLDTIDIMGQCNLVSKRWCCVKAQWTTLKYHGHVGLQNLKKIMNKTIIKNMVCLELSGVDDSYLQYVGSLKQLEFLNLTRCDEITDQGLEHISSLQQLESLSLLGCYEITDQGLKYISSLQRLKSLNVSYCGEITDQGLKHISSLQQLKSLNLKQCDKITNQGLVVLYKNNKTCTIEKN